jgi:hypothetical protein
MKLESLPDTIRAIVSQAGGLGLRGAFVYVGAHNLTYRCPEPVGEYRSSRPSRLPCGDSPERIYDNWVANVTTAPWSNPDAECCCAIRLNTRRRATGFRLVGIGTWTASSSSPAMQADRRPAAPPEAGSQFGSPG